MTTQTFKPDGRFHSESKNLRGIIDNARRHGNVSAVRITELANSRYATLVKVEYTDGFYSLCNFADTTICQNYFNRRWPGKIKVTHQP